MALRQSLGDPGLPRLTLSQISKIKPQSSVVFFSSVTFSTSGSNGLLDPNNGILNYLKFVTSPGKKDEGKSGDASVVNLDCSSTCTSTTLRSSSLEGAPHYAEKWVALTRKAREKVLSFEKNW